MTIPLINIKIHTTAALLVKCGTEHKRACDFCNKENHVSHKCLKMSDPKARFSILRRKKLCLYVLREDICLSTVQNLKIINVRNVPQSIIYRYVQDKLFPLLLS